MHKPTDKRQHFNSQCFRKYCIHKAFLNSFSFISFKYRQPPVTISLYVLIACKTCCTCCTKEDLMPRGILSQWISMSLPSKKVVRSKYCSYILFFGLFIGGTGVRVNPLPICTRHHVHSLLKPYIYLQ